VKGYLLISTLIPKHTDISCQLVVVNQLGCALWNTVFFLIGGIGFRVMVVGRIDRLYSSILFLVFAGGVIVLVFYTVRQTCL